MQKGVGVRGRFMSMVRHYDISEYIGNHGRAAGIELSESLPGQNTPR